MNIVLTSNIDFLSEELVSSQWVVCAWPMAIDGLMAHHRECPLAIAVGAHRWSQVDFQLKSL
jgi:hypothetical protein